MDKTWKESFGNRRLDEFQAQKTQENFNKKKKIVPLTNDQFWHRIS